MTEIAGRVQQQSDSIAVDGTGATTIRADREGALFDGSISSKYRQWLVAGKVFEAHFATEGGTSTIEANGTVDLTEPLFRLTVPSSKILVPIRVRLSPTTVWTTADAIFQTTSTGDTYSSGGAVPDVRNMAAVNASDSALGSTACTSIFDGDSGITESALVSPRAFGHQSYVTGNLAANYDYSILKGDPMIMIHGSSSWQIHAILTGAHEVHYSILWAELDKNALVNG